MISIDILLCAVILVLVAVHWLERRDLYNRIMSGSLDEYKGEKHIRAPSAHERAIKRWRQKGGEKR